MLYVTTRNSRDPVTSNHSLEHSRGVDGGFCVPYHAPRFTSADLAAWKNRSFNQIVADLLNILFGKNLTSWDLDFSIGRYPVRIRELNGRVIMVEPWHNPGWMFDNMVSRICTLLGSDNTGDWSRISVRAAVLFGVYGELLRMGMIQQGEKLDASVLAGDFVDPISVWYAREWGLPVENVVCCCNENNSLWNLICQGQMRTDTQCIHTCLPEADVALPNDLERLISACGSQSDVEDYLEHCRNGRMYIPQGPLLEKMRQGLFVSVVSSNRLRQIIGGVFSSHRYLLSPVGALNYAGLQDYRAKKGQIRLSLVMTYDSPAKHSPLVSEAACIVPEKIQDYL